MKKISLLGSTGSIGVQTLQVAQHLKDIEIVGLAAKGGNLKLLEEQAKLFQPKIIGVYDPSAAKELRKRLPNFCIEEGMEGIKAVASYSESDLIVSAMTGTIGLVPTLEAIKASKNVALANKEALVSGGSLVTSLAKQKNVSIIPMDSEHSAIFQCLKEERRSAVHRIILTASGGPFRDYSSQQLDSVTPEEALKHPNWAMGAKITTDCSTLMNKGLEMIEAHWLFDVPAEKIEVIIHPQSLIHSMVEFLDASILAQIGYPKMFTPIQYALTFPERKPGLLKPFDFIKHDTLQFRVPDREKFRCLSLAYDSLRLGKSMPCFMNAANEVLVNRFLNREISWKEIALKLELLMNQHQLQKTETLEVILEIDEDARKRAQLI